MALYGGFTTSMMGMMSQSRSLHNIGVNIANVNTGGYKGTETHFSTVLSRTIDPTTSDVGGVRPMDKPNVEKQGNLVSTGQATDVAISGKGFFVLNTAQDGSGDSFYGRDGSFQIKTVNDVSVTGTGGTTITVKDGYLADKNGYFVQGWAYRNGTVTTTGTPASLRVDQYAFINNFQATTRGTLTLNLPAGDTVGHANPYDITVYDSAGKRQSARLDFTRTGTNAWNVTTTTSRTAVAQVDTVTMGGSVGESGDVYSVTVNGFAASYTTNGTEASLNAIRDALVTQINSNTSISTSVTAAAGAAGQITLTAKTAGQSFTSAASATQGPVSVAQANRITLGGTVEIGDIYSITVNGITLSATAGGADTLTTLRDNLLGQINAHGTLGPQVTASANGTAAIDLVSDTAGVAFTLTAAATNGNVTADNTNTVTTVTANYTALNDNTATVANTTANVTNSVTSAATAITFKSDGTVNTPTSLTLPLTFAGGGTATVALDISNITQYYGEFLPVSYTKDGFASSNMSSFTFDEVGNVVGVFEDGSYRDIYKLSLGVFTNPNGLESINGNVYRPTEDSGDVRLVTAGDNGYASFNPGAVELSNVDIANEFTKMMITQTAYNASSTVFRTTDEMTTVARDLKR